MTRTTNARIAGFTFIFYIAAGITSLVLSGRAIIGDGIAAKLASIAQNETEMRIVVLLSLLTCFSRSPWGRRSTQSHASRIVISPCLA